MSVMKMDRAQSVCQSVRPKRSDPSPNDDADNEAKLYRCLLALFSENINALLRSHRDCLLETEPYPKIKVTREEQQVAAEARYEEKIARDAHARNATIKRNYDDFRRDYHAAFPSALSPTLLDPIPLDPALTTPQDTPDKLDLSKTLSRRNLSTRSASPNTRPKSSKMTRRQRGLTAINEAMNILGNSSQIYKLKTITAHTVDRKEQAEPVERTENSSSNHRCFMVATNRTLLRDHKSAFSKTFFHGGKPHHAKESRRGVDQEQEGNDCLLRAFASDCPSSPTPSSTYNKACAKRLITLKFTQKKSFCPKPPLQINDRVMLVNSVLSINLTPGQGYRPKSRCWQSYFN